MTHRSSTARRLITAISNDNLKDIQGVLRLGASTEDATDALGYAACLGKIECVQVLLPYSNPLADNSGALRMASAKGFSNCVDALLPFSNANARDGEALSIAAQNNNLECVQKLLPHTNPKWYSYALHSATIYQHRQCIKILLEFPCCAQELLNELKHIYPHNLEKWHVLEEELQVKNITSALPPINTLHKRKI